MIQSKTAYHYIQTGFGSSQNQAYSCLPLEKTAEFARSGTALKKARLSVSEVIYEFSHSALDSLRTLCSVVKRTYERALCINSFHLSPFLSYSENRELGQLGRFFITHLYYGAELNFLNR
uniref:Cysteine-rich transmembrane CYSTM domain-containing protein n=1 Tax=Parascaris univalens TaxID=6257 RepID=A0A915CIC9_PARUN